MKLLFLLMLPAALLQAQFEAKTSMKVLTIEDETEYDNRPMLRFKPNGEAVMLYSLEKGGFYIRHLDKKLGALGSDLQFADMSHLDMVVLDDNNMVVLARGKAGYTSAPSMIANYDNILYLMKIDKSGKVLFKTKVMGHEGYKAGSFFLCSYTNSACLAYDGNKFSIFAETCGNFADDDNVEPDVHETDYFVEVDNNGKVINDSKEIWKTAHSSLPQLAINKSGTAFTLAVGDGAPFGINYYAYQNNEEKATAILYPHQDELPSEDMYSICESTTDAGQIGSLQLDGDYLVTVAATIESKQMPMKMGESKKDLLFLRWSQDGKTVQEKWISVTPNTNESMPYIMPYNDKWLLIYHHQTEEYQIEGKAVMVLLDKEGKMLGKPYATDLDIDWHSQFFTYPNGDIGWICTGAYASEVKVYRVAQ